jgi:hypothetical protein
VAAPRRTSTPVSPVALPHGGQASAAVPRFAGPVKGGATTSSGSQANLQQQLVHDRQAAQAQARGTAKGSQIFGSRAVQGQQPTGLNTARDFGHWTAQALEHHPEQRRLSLSSEQPGASTTPAAMPTTMRDLGHWTAQATRTPTSATRRASGSHEVTAATTTSGDLGHWASKTPERSPREQETRRAVRKTSSSDYGAHVAE